MNLFTSSPKGSLIVQINNPVDYILGIETISIPCTVLTVNQCVELVARYAKMCGPYLRHAGVSIEDYSKKACEWKNADFAIILPEGVTEKMRIVQLSAEYETSKVTGIPQPTPLPKPASTWRMHALFLSETGEFLWVSIACKGIGDSRLHIEYVTVEFVAQLFSTFSDSFETALQQFGVMWNDVSEKMEERANKVRTKADSYMRIFERANFAP